MVSSDFGKLEVRRHFTSGEDCAIAGEATVAAAAPAADTFKKSRRFISENLLVGRFPHSCSVSSAGDSVAPKALCRRSLTWNFSRGIRDEGMTALFKRKSND